MPTERTDMKINRYELDATWMYLQKDGRYVLYSDHIATLAEREKEIEGLNKMLSMKQDDWMEVCKENDRLTGLLAEAKKVYEEIKHLDKLLLCEETPKKDDPCFMHYLMQTVDAYIKAWQVIKKIGEVK